MPQKVFAMVSAKQSFMHGAAIDRFEPNPDVKGSMLKGVFVSISSEMEVAEQNQRVIGLVAQAENRDPS